VRRQTILNKLRENPEISVLIVGAGINGIGVFRDLSLQGVDVLLIDKGDYCSGASAASSHMVHGGIRYLENGEFRLVREAVQERNRLIENAPHLVKPLPTVFPIFKWLSGILNAPLKFLGLLDRPAERGALVVKIGMLVYDAYTRLQSTVPRHQFSMRQKSLEKFPQLNPEILCTGTYYDAAMPSPERICVELIQDARAFNSQAYTLNYASLASAQGDTVIIKDEVDGGSIHLKPHLVINAAGPWIDFVNERMSLKTEMIGGTKGSHLVLNHPELRTAISNHEFFFENKDGRIVLIFPLQDKVMIGTSDIRIDNPDDARCTEEEIEYFFEMVGRVFPNISLERKQIIFSFSGVRPLPSSPKGFTGQISRDHSIEVVESGDGIDVPVYSLVGGKWTTFRAFAEQVTNKSLAYLGKQRKTDTKYLPIGGGKDYPEDAQKWITSTANNLGVDIKKVELLFERYGTRAEKLTEFISQGADEDLEYLPGYSKREIEFLVRFEDIVHLDDLILRRTLMAYLGQVTDQLIRELADILGEVLDWSEDVRSREVKRTKATLAEKHPVVFH
jgi:glycerol-3-phosphate dehydrogenase